MTTRPRDPLLTAARLLLTVCMGLALLVASATALAVPAVIIFSGKVLSHLSAENGHALGWDTIWAINSILALASLMAALAFGWLRLLRRIVDSVAEGDPFAPENSERLSRMGWLTVAIEAISIPIGGIGQWLAATIKDATSDFGISIGGVLLALVLFILARVFREGTRLRAELEGTV